MNPDDAQLVFDLARTWQIVAAVAAVWAVIATLAVPFVSFRLSAKWQERQERRRLKLWVFGTLMQDRGGPVSVDAVRAYNLIDSLSYDSRIVRDKWADYYNSLADSRLNSQEGWRIRDDKRHVLLRSMADDIGLGKSFVSDDFSRVYYPDGLAEQAAINTLQQQILKQELLARKQQSSRNPKDYEEDGSHKS